MASRAGSAPDEHGGERLTWAINDIRTRPPDVVTPVESTLLDLDGDGVPDTVQTSRTVGFDVTNDGVADVVETTDEVASEIDIDGIPHHVEVTQTIEADLDRDGALDVVDEVSVAAQSSEELAHAGTGRPRQRRRRAVLARSAPWHRPASRGLGLRRYPGASSLPARRARARDSVLVAGRRHSGLDRS